MPPRVARTDLAQVPSSVPLVTNTYGALDMDASASLPEPGLPTNDLTAKLAAATLRQAPTAEASAAAPSCSPLLTSSSVSGSRASDAFLPKFMGGKGTPQISTSAPPSSSQRPLVSGTQAIPVSEEDALLRSIGADKLADELEDPGPITSNIFESLPLFPFTSLLVDFISDIGSSEVALLNGESLLTLAFRKRNGVNMKFGGQLVHASWVIERTIETLRSADLRPHIVFFGAFEAEWRKQGPSYSAFRHAMMWRLEQHSAVPVHVLPAWAHGEHWTKLLEDVRPAYMIMSWTLRSPSHLIAYQSHASSLDLVDLESLTMDYGVLKAYHIAVPFVIQPLKHELPIVEHVQLMLNVRLSAVMPLPTAFLRMHALALAMLDDIPVNMAAMWVVYMVAHHVLPLAQRALQVTQPELELTSMGRKVLMFIDFYLLQRLVPYDETVADLFDGRLLHVVCGSADIVSVLRIEHGSLLSLIHDVVRALGGPDLRNVPLKPLVALSPRKPTPPPIRKILPVRSEHLQAIAPLMADVQAWEEAPRDPVGRPRRTFHDHHYHTGRLFRHYTELFEKEHTTGRRDHTAVVQTVPGVTRIDALRKANELQRIQDTGRRAIAERMINPDSPLTTAQDNADEPEALHPVTVKGPISNMYEKLTSNYVTVTTNARLEFYRDLRKIFKFVLDGGQLSEHDREQVLVIVAKLQLPDLGEVLRLAMDGRIDDARALANSEASGIPTGAVAFQLQEHAHKLRRPKGLHDDRVTFQPDTWQVHLLDAVDAGYSILAVAPTSAGKTFVSYYAMESVLRASHDGIVVYVAPTKALVNQVYEEIQARICKKYPDQKRNQMVGIFTRDDRTNMDTCQILVTVPQCLMILLLRPDGDAWAQRIRYVIHDEVHLIGSENGDVIEQLLLLTDAPFIALSATLGDADRLGEWLGDLERSRGRDLVRIVHNERYNDLEYYVWNSSNIKPVCAQWALLAPGSTLPEDARLLPEHAVELCKALYDFADREPALRDRLDTLKLRRAPFGLAMREVTAWSKQLLGVLSSLPREHSAAILSSMPSVQATIKATGYADKDRALSDNDVDYLIHNIVPLLRRMRDANMFGALVFCWLRDMCEILACKAAGIYENDDIYEAVTTLALPPRAKHVAERAWRKIRKIEKTGEGRRELASLYKMLDEIGAFYGPKTSKAPLVDPADCVTIEVLQSSEYLGTDFDVKQPLHRALLRGIGAHHSGLELRYRHTVERLFRNGKLAVVFCTTTLALGINMPCRTTVFAGSATYLNALTFRQIAGRAGRRGYDLRGRVVFFGLSAARIRRLLLSSLPSLRTNQLLSSSFALRACIAIHGVVAYPSRSEHGRPQHGNPQRLVDGMARILELGRSRLGATAALTRQVGFRFCLDTLRQAGLIDENANPNQWGTLVSHLFYCEPSNFALHRLVTADSCRLLADFDERTLMIILCRLFSTVPARRGDIIVPSLPKEPPSVRDELRKWSYMLRDQVVTTWRTIAETNVHNLPPDLTLPYSGGHPCSSALASERLTSAMAPFVVQSSLRSAFVATSGRGDRFKSIDELQETQRPGLNFEKELVPMYRRRSRLSAYLFDFYQNGDLNRIVDTYLMSRAEAPEMLRNFERQLRTLSTAYRVNAGLGLETSLHRGILHNIASKMHRIWIRFKDNLENINAPRNVDAVLEDVVMADDSDTSDSSDSDDE